MNQVLAVICCAVLWFLGAPLWLAALPILFEGLCLVCQRVDEP